MLIAIYEDITKTINEIKKGHGRDDEVVYCLLKLNNRECCNVRYEKKWYPYRKLSEVEKKVVCSGICPECLKKIMKRKGKGWRDRK